MTPQGGTCGDATFATARFINKSIHRLPPTSSTARDAPSRRPRVSVRAKPHDHPKQGLAATVTKSGLDGGGRTAALRRAHRDVGDVVFTGAGKRGARHDSDRENVYRGNHAEVQGREPIADRAMRLVFQWLRALRGCRGVMAGRLGGPRKVRLGKLGGRLGDGVPGQEHRIKRHPGKRECSGEAAVPMQSALGHKLILVLYNTPFQGVVSRSRVVISYAGCRGFAPDPLGKFHFRRIDLGSRSLTLGQV